METTTTVTSNGAKCGTVGIGTAAVLTAALPALRVRIRVAVAATPTAGDPRAPLGCPWASLPFRQGARLSPSTTLAGALAACRLVVRSARRACRSTHLLALAATAWAALHACPALCRRVLPRARQDSRSTSGAAATATARAASRDIREAHRLAHQGTNGARQRAVAGTGRWPCLVIRRALLRAGGWRPPTRRGATTNTTSGSLLDRHLCGARLTCPPPGGSTNAEVREARRTSSGC